MKQTMIIFALSLVLLAGCNQQQVASEAPSESVFLSEYSASISIPSQPESTVEPITVPESSAPESSVLPEPAPKPSQLPIMKEVAAISDEQAIAALNQPLEQLEALSTTSIVWGPGATSGEQRPAEPMRLQNQYGDQGAYFVMPESKQIYLSFDEGYELGYTDEILDTLKEKDVKAVFFVTYGYAKSRPDLIQRMIDEGHILGNHSTQHPAGGMPTLSALNIAKDILYLHEYIRTNFDYEMTLFRPPEGTFSEQSLAVLDALGYKSVFWSFAYRDWETDNQPVPADALQTIVGRSHPGAIYLLHAVSTTNTAVLGDAIDQLRQKGYEFSDWQL